MKAINEHEVSAVLALSAPERYKHFIKRVADWQVAWSLRSNDGWAMSADEEGHEIVPLWPHEQYALACAIGDWEDDSAVEVDLDTLLHRWIPGMIQSQEKVAVFPSPGLSAVVVTPQRLLADLKEEMEQYD